MSKRNQDLWSYQLHNYEQQNMLDIAPKESARGGVISSHIPPFNISYAKLLLHACDMSTIPYKNTTCYFIVKEGKKYFC